MGGWYLMCPESPSVPTGAVWQGVQPIRLKTKPSDWAAGKRGLATVGIRGNIANDCGMSCLL